MPDFTVLIPTHNHEDTLRYSVASVQWQTRQDFELFIVGDGVGQRTRDVVAELMANDNRIRFFDNPKGQRNGERARHEALQHARGSFVCYLGDDDIWLPEHLETMAGLLAQHDLAHTIQIEVAPDDSLHATVFDAATDPLAIQKMERREAGFGLSTGGHTLEAYRKLPHGWMPAPQHMASDLHFWLQFLYEPWCRYVSEKWPDILHLSSVTRRDFDTRQRTDEIARWWNDVQTAEQRAAIVRRSMTPLVEKLAHPQSANAAALASAIDDLTRRLSESREQESPSLQPYTAGEVIRFGSDGQLLRYAHAGLLPAESWGCWTGSAPAQIVLPLAAPIAGRAVLRLEAVLLLHPPARTSSAFEVKVNRRTLLQVHESRPQAGYTLAIPSSLCADARVLVVEIVPLMPVSPQELGLGSDPRALGVGLISLSVEDHPAAP